MTKLDLTNAVWKGEPTKDMSCMPHVKTRWKTVFYLPKCGGHYGSVHRLQVYVFAATAKSLTLLLEPL